MHSSSFLVWDLNSFYSFGRFISKRKSSEAVPIFDLNLAKEYEFGKYYNNFMQDRYIGKQAAINLKSYAYKSTNASLVYHYFTSPLTQFLVDRMPRTISPNSMSVTGFFCVFFFYSITMGFYYYDTVPTWLMILSAGLIFCYSIIDNMDGKQARRTGASSPLGLMIDH